MAGKGDSFHEKHRQRLKQRFLNAIEDGVYEDALEEHEFVELLLFYAIPLKNTNEIAHRLRNEFGSIGAIFDADIEQLMQIEGIGHHAATLLKLIPAAAKRYINDINDIKNARLTPQTVHKYIKNLFYGHTKEIAYILFMDADCVVRKIRRLSSGTVNATPIYTREVVKLAVNERYPYVMLAHNHPNGNAMPSPDDLKITELVDRALSFIEVRLIDHVIVSGGEVTSIAANFDILK